MPALEFSIPHKLDPDDVVRRIQGFMAKLREKNEAKFLVKSEAWHDRTLNCSFSSFGFAMDAVMDVQPTALNFQLTIPFAAMLFKGQIEDGLRGELTKVLA
jgi:hypothetical protein